MSCFTHSIRPLLYVFKTLLFTTLTVNKNNKIVEVLLQIFVGCPIFTFVCLCLYEEFINYNLINYKVASTVSLLADHGITIITTIEYLILIIYFNISKEKLNILLENITYLESRGLCIHEPRKYILKQFVTILFIFAAVTYYDLHSYLYYMNNITITFYLGYAIPLYLSFINLYIMSLFLNATKRAFCIINNKLHTLIDNNDHQNTVENMNYLFKLINIHSYASNLAIKENNYFSVLVTIFSVQVCLSCSVYNHFFVRTLLSYYFGGEYEMSLAINNYLWCCGLIFLLAVVIRVWVSTQNEANKAALLVHELWNKKSSYLKFNQQNFKLISLQLLHGKTKFTACGLFPLDYSLLHMIIGSITTYIVILVQFDT